MFMSVVDSATRIRPSYPEIAGMRILVTGLKPAVGAELALALAEHEARLILAFDAEGEEVTALTELAAQTAAELKVYTGRATDAAASIHLARNAVQAFGGLDVVINLADLAPADVPADATEAAIEQLVLERLTTPCLVTRISANRMQLTRTEGLILNIAAFAAEPTPAAEALAMFTRTALAAMTRAESRRWADSGIRVNAVAPSVVRDGGWRDAGEERRAASNEPDLTALALFLASGRGKSLSGHVFDAKGVAGLRG